MDYGTIGIRTWYSSHVSGTPQGLRFESLTGVMGWSQRSRGYSVRARGYERNYGVEPEAMVSESMTGIMGGRGSQRLWCKSQRL